MFGQSDTTNQATATEQKYHCILNAQVPCELVVATSALVIIMASMGAALWFVAG